MAESKSQVGDNRPWKDHLYSLAAALLDGLFEHPVLKRVSIPQKILMTLAYKPSFSAAC
jgi:hypothetical protein